jgi:hypothetical protein
MLQQKQRLPAQLLTLLLALLLAAWLLAGCRPVQATNDGQSGAGGQTWGDKNETRTGDGQQRTNEGQYPHQSPPPVVTWDATPACHNNPQALSAWRAEFTAPAEAGAARLEMLLGQLHRATRQLPAYTVASMAALLAADPAADADAATARKQALAVLWLNLVDERLSRATTLTGAELLGADAPTTAGALIDQLAAAQAGSAQWGALLEMAAAVGAGEGLGVQVCAQLVYRAENELRTAQWIDAGSQTITHSLAAPNGFTTFSPDYTRLVVQTPRGDTAGGPLYLYDLASEQTVNLNEQSGLPSYNSISALKVVGWHPNNNYLLLANEDDEVTIRLDVESGEYTPLNLGIDTSQMAAPRALAPAPNGSGFAFLTYDRATEATQLYWYDVQTAAARAVLTLNNKEGDLEALQVAPDGQQAVFVLHTGSRREGRSEELRLVDLDSGEQQVLLSGPLGPLQPVWSPDGKQIAYVQRSMDKPLKAGPQVAMPLGDIWTIDVASGELQQLTFTQAITRPPVWSPAGKLLAFVTAGGELGLVSSSEPGVIWRIGDQLLQPQFTRLGFIP